MSRRGEVLVAILNDRLDFNIALERRWYRIPVTSADKWLKDCWPPAWLAFYQTKIFGAEAFAVNYFARVLAIQEAYRWQLFPDQPGDEKSRRRYYKVCLDELRPLPTPIRSRRRRRLVFIPTTWRKLMAATEIEDLYDESPLEDLLWIELKQLEIYAERQVFLEVGRHNYSLDFAIYCASGNLNVETDGDTWHANPEKAALDMVRDNDLQTAGWTQLHFNTHQIREAMPDYCVPQVVKAVNGLGGLDDGQWAPKYLSLNAPARQLSLFDDP